MFRVLPLLGLLLALHGAPAVAQAVCDNRAVMVKKLTDRYGEVQMSLGLAGTNLFETWANCLTGTWTILKTYPKGRSCLMAAGDGWQSKVCPPGQLIRRGETT